MEFKKYKLNEILTLNPTLKLKKNTIAKKIAMENIKEYQKKIDSYTYSEFKSGSKFMNGDTLLARITPCLENGKTAYVDILDKNEIAFGSTEFFVLRPKNSLLDSHFLYYLMRTNELRKTVIKSMTGTSGRQRAQKESILEYEFCLPSLKVQKTIAKLLKNLDDKIEVNKKIIANLEELSQTLFKRWFVDFEFPDENGNPYKSNDGEMIDSELGEIPEGWTVKPLKEFIDIIDNRGKTPPLDKKIKTHPIIDVKALSGDSRVIDYKKCLKFVSEETYNTWFRSGHPKKGDTLLSTVGSIGEIKMFYYDVGTIAQNVVSLRSENSYFTYDLINNVKSSFLTFNIGSVQPSIKITHINKIKVVYPSKIVIENYEKMIKKLISDLYVKDLENQNLTQLRDTLLPKLMSGEIEIPDDIEVNEDELSI